MLARGNTVLEGYWQQPDATADALEGGWFHTGDGGTLDDEGYLSISDRKKDVIITGGENVSSIEVEDCLFSHPAVAEVAVIGVPSEKWGETIKALVVLADGASRRRGRAHRPLQGAAGRLQGADVGRAPRGDPAHGDRQGAEVQAAPAVLGRARSARSTDRLTHRPSMVSNVGTTTTSTGDVMQLHRGGRGDGPGLPRGPAVGAPGRRALAAWSSPAVRRRCGDEPLEVHGRPARTALVRRRRTSSSGPLTGTVVLSRTRPLRSTAWSPCAGRVVLLGAGRRASPGCCSASPAACGDGDPFTTHERPPPRRAVGVVLSSAACPAGRRRASPPTLLLDAAPARGPTSRTRFELSLWPVPVGLLLCFLAEVFARGARLREDVEGLV